jgi:hypothetical protein
MAMGQFDPTFKAAEQLRFNALSPDAAQRILNEAEGKEIALRSCWYCNSAHKHLSRVDYPFNCLWGCGNWYIGGFPAPIVSMRAKNEPITEVIMDNFEQTIDSL